MPDLHAACIASAEQSAFVHTAAADPGSWKDTDNTTGLLPCPESVLTKNSGVNIVGNLGMKTELVLNALANRYLLPAKIRSFTNNALLKIQRSRAADT